ncbi:MFS transporter [Janibacter sp. GXQ6167]|uniref:MFS transporter n=1 Tax=Janibacter sp. GXQ6167 TaxID=3240791 RepID=UPI003523EE55
MTGTSGVGSYRQLLASSTTRRTYVLSSLGRSAYAMLPLLFLFTVRQASGSFAVAATAMSLVALTSLSMPVKSRLIDRHGQRRVLVPFGVGVALALVAATGMAAAEVTSPAAWWTVAVAQGLLAPPLGPAMRAQWRALAPASTRTAYALDAVTEEVLWLLGPAVAGLLLALGHAKHGLLVVPALILVGSFGLAWSPVQGTLPEAEAGVAARVLRQPRLWPALGLMATFGGASALLFTGVAARADSLHQPSLAAVTETVIGVGAVAGGLLWGRARVMGPAKRSVIALLGSWAVLVAISTLVDLDSWALIALLLAGAAGSPLWVITYEAADRAVKPSARTEASTWVTTMANLGGSGGTALAGLLAATNRPTAPVTLAAAIAGSAALLALAATMAHRPGPPSR